MTDLVRIFEAYAEANDMYFNHGGQSSHNLLRNNDNPDKIHFLSFLITRTTIQSSNSLRVQGTRYTGRFMMLLGSNFANHYFNEADNDQSEGKFTLHVEPLLRHWEGLANYLMCTDGLEIDLFQVDEAINVLDVNKDGIWCTYNIVQRK